MHYHAFITWSGWTDDDRFCCTPETGAHFRTSIYAAYCRTAVSSRAWQQRDTDAPCVKRSNNRRNDIIFAVHNNFYSFDKLNKNTFYIFNLCSLELLRLKLWYVSWRKLKTYHPLKNVFLAAPLIITIIICEFGRRNELRRRVHRRRPNRIAKCHKSVCWGKYHVLRVVVRARVLYTSFRTVFFEAYRRNA
jgi:hypothetical protein